MIHRHVRTSANLTFAALQPESFINSKVSYQWILCWFQCLCCFGSHTYAEQETVEPKKTQNAEDGMSWSSGKVHITKQCCLHAHTIWSPQTVFNSNEWMNPTCNITMKCSISLPYLLLDYWIDKNVENNHPVSFLSICLWHVIAAFQLFHAYIKWVAMVLDHISVSPSACGSASDPFFIRQEQITQNYQCC